MPTWRPHPRPHVQHLDATLARQTTAAFTGRARTARARDALKTLGNHKFHIVFIDAMLPDLDGLELAKLIRQNDPQAGIVMISGYFYEDDVSVQQAIGQGIISAFISKPFLEEEIVGALRLLKA